MRRKTEPEQKRARKGRQIDTTDKLVGQRVRLRRMHKGVSQKALAEQLGVTFQQVQKYENGQNRITASKLKTIAASLDMPVQFFLQTDEDQQSPKHEDSLTHLLKDRDAISLIRAFSSISDKHLRKAIVDHVRSLAELKKSFEPAER
jgi:transcriptional regulator with XRE-family HTH domain